MKTYILLVTVLLSNMCIAQKDSTVCPLEGRTPNDMARKVNLLKNRDVAAGTVNPAITLDSILRGGPEDTGRYKITDYATITGYVMEAEDIGPESCNCFSTDSSKQNLRIYVGQSVNSWKDSVFVVEVTAKYKQQHPQLNGDALIGQQITVTGMMMYNFEAKKFTLNGNKTSRKTDRKTAWEICPVTDLKVNTLTVTK
ncbi:MAG TPA: hypothetical protein VK783_14820 [Bacteroidia bacterium]|nr:hypothetical protein [Bacteroidia bacterium]